MQFVVSLLSLIALVSAAPAQLRARGDATCGSHQYSASAVTAASQAACQHVQDGDTAGSSTYPHQYKNFEGFNFQGLSGPFYEFPILASGSIYSGGT